MKIKTIFLLPLAAIVNPTAAWGAFPLQKAGCGTIERLEVVAPQLNDTIEIDVWLLCDFNKVNRNPVLYMHDDQNIFYASITWNHQSWEMDLTPCRMIEQSVIEPMIIVGIHSDPERGFLSLCLSRQ